MFSKKPNGVYLKVHESQDSPGQKEPLTSQNTLGDTQPHQPGVAEVW